MRCLHPACSDALSPCTLQAVASAHKALSSALTGVQLQGDEEEVLGKRLKAAADKKLGDLLQVCCKHRAQQGGDSWAQPVYAAQHGKACCSCKAMHSSSGLPQKAGEDCQCIVGSLRCK